MANQTITITLNYEIPVAPNKCASVYICLTDPTISADGNGLIVGTIQFTNVIRPMQNSAAISGQYNSVSAEFWQYRLTYDDAQMATVEDVPIELDCSDISEINPYYCTTTRLITGAVEQAQICLQPQTEEPTEQIAAGCIISYVGHATNPDGLYYYNGSTWVLLGAY